MLTLLIDNGTQMFNPTVEDKISWSLKRIGTPGKLTFHVLANPDFPFQEGDIVGVHYNGTAVFYGFIFELKRTKDNRIQVTAYDQLRYLKNKDSYNYENLTAKAVIEMIAADFHLKIGELADTGYVIPVRSEPDKTLFDIILNALDLTMIETKKIFTLYDDYGKLMLKDMEQMKLDLVITAVNAENFDYSSSIDGETYNQVKVSIDNEQSGKKDIYLAQGIENMKQWGVLQHYHKAEKNTGEGQALADSLLKKYNQKTKKLSVKNALGDIRVRAGSLIPVALDLGDVKVHHYLVVDEITHNFTGNLHTMDLNLRGNVFNG